MNYFILTNTHTKFRDKEDQGCQLGAVGFLCWVYPALSRITSQRITSQGQGVGSKTTKAASIDEYSRTLCMEKREKACDVCMCDRLIRLVDS